MSRSRKQLPGHQLFYYSSCPYCIRVRLVLWLTRLELPLKDVLSHPENMSELIAGGGKTQVPCLCIEDDQNVVRWMYETTDIIRYLKRQAVAVHSKNPGQ